MSSSLERRRFSRFIIPLEVRYHTHCPMSGELHRGQGVLRDISLTGSFFHVEHVEHQVDFQPGQILALTIAAPLPFMDNNHISQFTAAGEVIRLEPPSPANPSFGVAINFLQALSFAPV